MKSVLIALLFIFVTPVFAKEIITLGNAARIVQSPEACLETSGVCALKTGPDEKFKFNIGKTQIVLDENTAVVLRSDNKLTLVIGQIWVHAKDEIEIETEYGSAKAFDGNFLAKNKDKKMDLKAIDADLMLTPKMSEKSLKLEAGEENWLGPVDQTRTASSGLPLPIRPSDLVVNWARLYTGTKVDFEKDFKNFFKLWSLASERLAEFHAEVTKRQIASIENEIARKKQILANQARENARIKAWFRKHSLED